MEKPREFVSKSDEECRAIIEAQKAALGERLVTLVHHYQRREIVPYADYLGDSYALSAIAAKQTQAEFIVFCGVHFMAESADILAAAGQRVFLPNPFAGCPMADMAPFRQVLAAWADLEEVLGAELPVPIAYMNSTAELKAFTGARGGLICTSANAERALDWAFARGSRVFFLPDQHLGRNTAKRKGYSGADILLFDPLLPLGGHSPAAIRRARVILWAGYCHVHMNFLPEHVLARRAEHPEAIIVVHPECREEVVDLADVVGSTNTIVQVVEQAARGAVIAIGTESNLVARLRAEHPDKTILPLSGENCPMCVNMFRTSLNDLAYTLATLETGGAFEVKVPAALKAQARLALDRMLELAGATK